MELKVPMKDGKEGEREKEYFSRRFFFFLLFCLLLFYNNSTNSCGLFLSVFFFLSFSSYFPLTDLPIICLAKTTVNWTLTKAPPPDTFSNHYYYYYHFFFISDSLFSDFNGCMLSRVGFYIHIEQIDIHYSTLLLFRAYFISFSSM